MDGERVLLAHRHPARRRYPDCWDVPGGHVEDGEAAASALVRELSEELGITIAPPSPEPRYRLVGDGHDLDLWVVRTWSGSIHNRAPEEHDDLRWFEAGDVAQLPLGHERYPELIAEVLATGNTAR